MNDEPASRPPLTGVPPSTSRRDLIGVVVAGLVWAAATALLAPALRDPGHVDHITIDNPHPWDVTIDATDGRTERLARHRARRVRRAAPLGRRARDAALKGAGSRTWDLSAWSNLDSPL